MSEWQEVSLESVAQINPTESLPKGKLAKKISMDALQPFTKNPSSYEVEPYNGGMKFKNGDTIVARITPCLENGKTAYINLLSENEVAFGSTEYIVLREKFGVTDKQFLYYFSISPIFRDVAIASMTGSSGRQRVQTNVVKQYLFEMPSLKEQKAIASVLSSLDDKIDLLHRQNTTLERMAETLFRQWFVEEAQEDWAEYKFKHIVQHVKPGTNYQPQRIESGIPFLNVRNLKNGFLDLSDVTYISMQEYERVHKVWKPEENDVLISRIGTLGIVAVISKRDLPVAVHYNMINTKAKLTSYQFLYFLLKSQYFQELYFSQIRQSVQEYVAIEDIENLDLKLPLNKPNFKEKECIFNDLYKKISINEAQIRILEKLRDNLLPKLMSGEVRVNSIQ